MQKWEYRTVLVNTRADPTSIPVGFDPAYRMDVVNDLGDQGWEVVSVWGDEKGLDHVWLKRPKG